MYDCAALNLVPLALWQQMLLEPLQLQVYAPSKATYVLAWAPKKW